MPWLIFLALLIGTFVAAYQSQQRADMVASRRFQEIVRAAEVSLQHELQETKDLLESTAAFISVLPNHQVDARSWANFFNAHSANGDDRHSLMRIDYLPGNTATSGVPPPVKLFYSFGAPPATSTPSAASAPASSAAEWQLDTTPAIAIAMADANKLRQPAVSEPITISSNSSNAKDSIAVAIVMATHPASIVSRSADDKLVDKPLLAPLQGQGQNQGQGHLIGLISFSDILAKISRAEGSRIRATLQDKSNPTNPDSATPRGQFSAIIGGNSAQEPWKIKITATPKLEDELHDASPKNILVVGIIASIVLAGLIWLLTRLRQQAESLSDSMTARLRDQMKLNEDIIEFNPSPIYRKDVDGRFIAVNRAWEQLSGYRRDDIIGKVNREIQTAELAAENDAADRKLYEIDGGYDVAERLVTNAEGRQLETMVAKQLVRRADGTVDGLIGTITDLSPVRRLEREIALQREQLDLVISASQQGIWDVELREGGNAYFSNAFREIIGYGSGGFPMPYIWKDNIHPDDQAAFAQEQIRHFKGEAPFFDIEARALRRDGSYVWVRTRAIARRDHDNRAVRFVGSIIDISDLKVAEMMLIEGSSRIAEAAKAKEAFLATMSHEIRTPLNGVLGMAALLANTPLNEEQHDYIRLIRASGDTLLNLINDVLDFSKIEAGHMNLESVAVELVALVEETFAIVADKAREKGIALVYDVRDDVPFYILGDATRLRQILMNLLSNAIKFTERGEIKLSITAQRNQAGKIILEGRVKDSGVGISQAQIAKLFTPFTQADASTTRKYGGTGLGLAIVKRLTEAMKGSVSVESVMGEGATFIFTIETQLARGPLRPYMQREVFDFLGKRALIIDSNASRRAIRQYRYSRWGFDVVTVAPDDAAATLRAKPGIDMVITDFVKPSVEAEEFKIALTANDNSRLMQRDKRIISILLSNETRADLAREKLLPAIRHDFFLVRPVSITKLFDVLMRAVLGELGVDKSSRPHNALTDADAVEITEVIETPKTMTTADANKLDVNAPPKDSASIVNQRHTKAGASRVKPVSTRVLDVLVAEDNEVNQRVIGGMLRNLGHRFMLVSDGRAAVEAATQHHFDAILMDIQMPILDGTTAMREIRAHFAEVDNEPCPPIVAMTAHALAGDREGYLSDGMDDYLSKPIRSVEVAAALERVTGHLPRVENETLNTITANLLAVAPPTVNKSVAPQNSAAFARNELAQRIDQLPLLDREQLEDLRYLPATTGGTNDASDPVGGLIRLFQSKAVERMDIIETCLANHEWKLLSDTAHSLRGASASVGFPRVAALCKDLELATRKLAEAAAEGSNDGSKGASTGDAKFATQSELDEIFELIRYYCSQADTALREWLIATAAPPV